MNRQNKLLVTLVGVFTLGIVSSVQAEEDGTKGACKADAQRLCAAVKPGSGAVRDCLKTHEAELSEACKNNIAQLKEKMKERKEEIKEACKADHEQFCKDVTPGEGREMACLKAYSDKLSAGCKGALPKHRAHHKKEARE